MWLRELLILGGASKESAAKKSTHSLKVTPISWMAKFNVELPIRRLFGHHVDPGTKSALTYSRDAMSGPLNVYIDILNQIRDRTFDPDSTRSARLKMKLSKILTTSPRKPSPSPQPVDSDEEQLNSYWKDHVESPTLDLPELEVQEDVGLCRDFAQSQADVSSSESDSSSESSDSDLSESEVPNPKNDDELVSQLFQESASPQSFLGIVYQHNRSGVIHAKGNKPDRMCCGQLIHSGYSRVSKLEFHWPICKNCKPYVN